MTKFPAVTGKAVIAALCNIIRCTGLTTEEFIYLL